jgi:hypothetical protein
MVWDPLLPTLILVNIMTTRLPHDYRWPWP